MSAPLTRERLIQLKQQLVKFQDNYIDPAYRDDRMMFSDAQRAIESLLAIMDAEPGKNSKSSRLLFSREQPVSVVVNDEVWRLFTVNFVHDDSLFSFGIYATSRCHASAIVADIRETAVLDEYDLVAFSLTPPDEITLAELERLTVKKIH